MRLTSKGITAIKGALDWAEMLTGESYRLEDVEIHQSALGRNRFDWWVGFQADDHPEIFGTGPTFEAAARAFYQAAKVANEDAKPDSRLVDTLDECNFCQRPITIRPDTTWIHKVNGGDLALEGVDYDENSPGECGWFPVGSRCASRINPRAAKMTTLELEGVANA